LSKQHLKFVNVRPDKVKNELDTLRRENKLLRQECEGLSWKLKELSFIYKKNPYLRQMAEDKSNASLGFTKLQSDQQTFGAAQLETGTEPIPFNRNEFLRFLETNQKSPRSAKRNSRNLSPSHSCPDIRSGIELLKQLPKHEDRSEVSPTRSASLDDEPIRQFNQTKPLPIPTKPQAHNIIQKGVCVRNPHT